MREELCGEEERVLLYFNIIYHHNIEQVSFFFFLRFVMGCNINGPNFLFCFNFFFFIVFLVLVSCSCDYCFPEIYKYIFSHFALVCDLASLCSA